MFSEFQIGSFIIHGKRWNQRSRNWQGPGKITEEKSRTIDGTSFFFTRSFVPRYCLDLDGPLFLKFSDVFDNLHRHVMSFSFDFFVTILIRIRGRHALLETPVQRDVLLEHMHRTQWGGE